MVKYPGWLGPHEPPRLTAANFNTRSITTTLLLYVKKRASVPSTFHNFDMTTIQNALQKNY